LRLTLDLELQKTAEAQLAGKVGALAALDPRTGEILAMVSAPTFDPNRFSTRISAADWESLAGDPNKPLQNRAIQNSYSPGSIFKVVMAEAGLEDGMIGSDTHVYCNGAGVFYNHTFRCAQHKGHGYVDLRTAIARSCNIFFYDLGRRLGIERIAAHAQSLGLGRRTGVDLPNERAGLMPSPEWKQRARGDRWYPGETISVSIGQGAVSVTPLQILRAVGAIAVGGKLTTPHLLLRAENARSAPSWPVANLKVNASSTHRIRDGMWGGVNEWGTGHNAQIPGLDICGKTGTVQVMSAERRRTARGAEFEDHSWFVGFAPRDNPEIAVVAFVEHGGKGGVAAAPMAREIFRTHFGDRRAPAMLSQLTPPATPR
jgi:penicillin-binding protein 2